MAITLTHTALEHLLNVISENNYENKLVRFGIRGGSCAGLEYILDFIDFDDINDDDNAFQFEGNDQILLVVVDPKSYLFTNGTVIDYQKTLLDSKFIFNNPLATGGCGCGKSFSVD